MKYQDATVLPSSIIIAEITLKVCVADTVSKSDSWDTLKLHCVFIQFRRKKPEEKKIPGGP